MNKILTTIVFLFLTIVASLFSENYKNNLSENALSFLKSYFPENEILRIKDEGNKNYEVILNDGTEITFINGDWKKIQSLHPLPEEIFPPMLIQYINENFTLNSIIEALKTKSTIKVELTNDAELIFTLEGILLHKELD